MPLKSEAIKSVLGDKSEYLFVLSGQSNADTDRNSGGPYVTNSDVLFWDNSNNQFINADFENANYSTALGDVVGGGSNSALLWFADEVQRLTGAKVYCVIDSKGGESIEKWYTGGFTNTIINTITSAISDDSAPSGLEVDAFMWLQGEKDLKNGMSYSNYATRFESLINQLNSQVWFDKERTAIMTATISDDYLESNNITSNLGVQIFLESLETQTETYGLTYVADVSKLTTVDGAHYDGNSKEILGRIRMINALEDQ